jgi:limonene 1,2-monooxygenase
VSTTRPGTRSSPRPRCSSRWPPSGPATSASAPASRRDTEFGLGEWADYFQRVAALRLAPDAADHASLVEALNSSGFAVSGTPDDAVAQLRRLAEQSDGFGTYLLMAHEWADREATLEGYELVSRYVMPELSGAASALTASRDWAAENRPEFIGAAGAAIVWAMQRHAEERSSDGG